MSEIKNESINFKYWDEMTPEERVQFDLDMWTDKKPDEGGPECVIKFFPLSAAALQTTIQTLDALSDAMALDAEKHDIRNEWDCLEANYLLELLNFGQSQTRGRFDLRS